MAIGRGLADLMITEADNFWSAGQVAMQVPSSSATGVVEGAISAAVDAGA